MPDMFTFDLTRSVYLIGEIDQYNCAYVVDELLRYDRNSNEDINLIINSEGGLVYSMFGVIDTMKSISSKVNAVILGQAASAASAIFVNATGKRVISENSHLMFHNMIAGTFGDVETIKDDVKDIEMFSEKYLASITDSIGISPEEFEQAIYKKDWHVFAEEAITKGMADMVLDAETKEAIKLSETLSIEIVDDINNIEVEQSVKIVRFGYYLRLSFTPMVVID